MLTRVPAILISLGLLVTVLAAGMGSAPPARAATDLRICGRVSVYVPATAATTGALTIGGVALVIAADTQLGARVRAGADLCVALDLAHGRIVAARITANASTTVSVCGVVTALARADSSSTGRLTIGGTRFVLGAGSTLPARVRVGADLCLQLTLDAFGQVRGANADVNATSVVAVCGVVTAYARATSNATGSLAIGGRTFRLAIGSRLPASVSVGADLCARLTLNALGQVQHGTVRADLLTTLEVCGAVATVVRAGTTSDGSLTIGDARYVVRAGTKLDAGVRAGASLKLRLGIDTFGRIAEATVLRAAATVAGACAASPPGGGGPTPSGDASPSPSPSPSDAVSPGTGENPGGDPSGSPDPTDAVLGENEERCEGTAPDAAANGQPPAGAGGVIPDTASLGRIGSVLAVGAVPLAILLAMLGMAALQRRRRAGPRVGEVAGS